MSETVSAVDRNAGKGSGKLSKWRLVSVLFKTRVVLLLLLAAIGSA